MNTWSQIVASHIDMVETKNSEIEIKPETKRCSSCNQFMSIGEFYAKTDSPNGLRAKCKNCYRKSLKRENDETNTRASHRMGA